MNIAARNRRPLIVLAALALLSGASFTPVFAADRGTVDDEAAYSPKDPEVECDLNPERCGETDPMELCAKNRRDDDCTSSKPGPKCDFDEEPYCGVEDPSPEQPLEGPDDDDPTVRPPDCGTNEPLPEPDADPEPDPFPQD